MTVLPVEPFMFMSAPLVMVISAIADTDNTKESEGIKTNELRYDMDSLLFKKRLQPSSVLHNITMITWIYYETLSTT